MHPNRIQRKSFWSMGVSFSLCITPCVARNSILLDTDQPSGGCEFNGTAGVGSARGAAGH